MKLFNFFSKAENDDTASVEKILSDYASSIAEKERALFETRGQQQHTLSRVALYGYGAWAVTLPLSYFRLLPLEDIYQIAIIICWPISVYLIRWALQIYASRNQRRKATENAIKALKTKQKAELEKFKKRTKFDETRSLLEKFDEPQARMAPAIPMPGTPIAVGSRSGTPRNSPGSVASRTPAQNRRVPDSPNATPSKFNTNAPNSLPASGMGSRRWVDRVADVLLGGDEGAPQNRYALICAQCFSHNGLVLKEELATTQYLCPKCGHFNPIKDAPSLKESPSLRLDAAETRKRTQSMHALSKGGLTASTSSPNLRLTTNTLDPGLHTRTGKPRRYSAAPNSPLARADDSEEEDLPPKRPDVVTEESDDFFSDDASADDDEEHRRPIALPQISSEMLGTSSTDSKTKSLQKQKSTDSLRARKKL